MRNFKIYGYKGTKRVLITNSKELSSASTYEENFSLLENKQCTLTFKILKHINSSEKNNYEELIYPYAKLYFELYNLDNELKFSTDFIITSYIPTFYEKNVEYSCTCNDFASVIFSKEGINLNLEKTGNIEELTEFVLSESRKNPYYKNLGNNYWSSVNIIETHNANKTNGILIFKDDTSYAIYDLKNSVVSIKPQFFSFYPQVSDTNILKNIQIKIDYLGDYEGQIFDNIIKDINLNEINKITLQLSNNIRYMKISFINCPSDLYLKELSIKIIPEEENLNKFWRLNPNFNLNDFTSDIITGTNSIYKKVTLSLENSNLYNGLIEIGNLFNAELDFDYNNKYISYKNKNKRYFKGYKINPTLNLKTLGREENVASFNTAMSVTGGSVNDTLISLIPTMPNCIRNYFLDCIDHNFGDFPNATEEDKNKFFYDYNKTKYIDIVKTILIQKENEYISLEEYEIQKDNLLKWAKVCDLAPCYDNRLYDISYFYNDKYKYITEAQYNEFNNIINNNLRKNNIKLNIYSYQYYQILTELSMANSEIEFLTENLVTEEIYLHEVEEKLRNLDPKYENTKTQWAIKEKISATLNNILKMKEELAKVYGINAVEENLGLEEFKLPTNCYPYYLIQYEGYSDKFTNAFTKLLSSISQEIENKQEEYETTINRLAEIEKIIAEEELTDYKLQTLETEQAGLKRQKTRIEKAIGYFPKEDDPDYVNSHYGYLLYRKDYVTQLYNLIDITKPIIGLYDYIVNYESDYNINKQKDLIIADLYNRYELYTIEGYYENTEELDSYGLMEQSKFIFDQNKYPVINYSLSVIDLSVLENFKFLDINIGDKIIIDDKELYKNYNKEEPRYLIITGINYVLRDASQTTLTIAKPEEELKLIQKLLLGITN